LIWHVRSWGEVADTKVEWSSSGTKSASSIVERTTSDATHGLVAGVARLGLEHDHRLAAAIAIAKAARVGGVVGVVSVVVVVGDVGTCL